MSRGGSIFFVLLSIFRVASSASFLHNHQNTRCLLHSFGGQHPKAPSAFTLSAKRQEESSKKSYQFGDITKTVVKKLTKKDKYEFGDLSRLMDKVAKQKVAELNQKEKYEVGDLAKYIDGKVKSEILEFTGNTNSTKKYEFGDISKEIVRRVVTRDFTHDDLIFLFKILLSFGAGLSPVANFLPTKLLMQLLDVSIAGSATKRVTAAITSELDKRMRKAITGDENYKLGDMSKKAMLNYIGKGEYEFGDISRFVLETVEEEKDNNDGKKESSNNKSSSKETGTGTATQKKLSLQDSMLGPDNPNRDLIAKELEEWDKNFLVQVDADNVAGKDRQRK